LVALRTEVFDKAVAECLPNDFGRVARIDFTSSGNRNESSELRKNAVRTTPLVKKVGRFQKDECVQFFRLFRRATMTVNAATTSRAR